MLLNLETLIYLHNCFHANLPNKFLDQNLSLQLYLAVVKNVEDNFYTYGGVQDAKASTHKRCTDGPLLFENAMSLLKYYGCLNSLDWTTGLDYWTGPLDCIF